MNTIQNNKTKTSKIPGKSKQKHHKGRNTLCKTRSRDVKKSRIEQVLGRYTTICIIAIIYNFTLLGFLIYIRMFQGMLSESITAAFITLLTGQAGYLMVSLQVRKLEK